ncbi:hypothetical protein PsorP6_010803 [Peronosclerospora sorghi]|uniref:Uncharacterized protein n=1 Tax=Peronosclerospora sorghi TaxID=230839 RepID=A0ACC0VVB3_9STRA|nr:hypothetical protein PsorP6_010803 [Peronosclerospora sorghi]
MWSGTVQQFGPTVRFVVRSGLAFQWLRSGLVRDVHERSGRLGTLPIFEEEFVLPIRAGGYATATKMQVLMAYKCSPEVASVLRRYIRRFRAISVLRHICNHPDLIVSYGDVDQKRQGYEDEELIVGGMTELLTETDEDQDEGESDASFGAASGSV